MTQKEKARAYDKALERARAMYGSIPTDNAMLEEIFPVLQRNDDYKILRLLEWYIKKDIDICESISTGLSKYQREKILAYIEKQKESLHIHEMSKENANSFINDDEDERIRKALIDALKTSKSVGELKFILPEPTREECLAYLEKQKEKGRNITANLLEDCITGVQRELIEFLANNIDASWVDVIKSSDAYAQRIRLMVEKQKEQKEIPLMGGDTDTYFDDLRITTKPLTSREWFDEGIKYAQRLQKEQKPAEWSEEDEKAINDACCFIEEYAGYIKGIDREKSSMLFRIAEKLKSLRPSWKPSEEEERLINTSISFLKDFADKGYENAVECIDWLKSKLNGNSGK